MSQAQPEEKHSVGQLKPTTKKGQQNGRIKLSEVKSQVSFSRKLKGLSL